MREVKAVAPLIYTPTVGEACLRVSQIMVMFLSLSFLV